MTTFEIIVTVAIIAIVVLLGFIAFCVWNHYRDAELSNFMLRKKLDNIDTNTATSVSVGIDIKDKVFYINSILHNGFKQTGNPHGGSYIEPINKH